MPNDTKQAWFMTEIANQKATALHYRDENEALRTMISDLERYLRSDKFAKDPTVQVTDVLTRLGRF